MKIFRKEKTIEPNYCGFWVSVINKSEAFFLCNRHKKYDGSITYDCLYASSYNNKPMWYDESNFIKDINNYTKIGIAEFRSILKENCYQEKLNEKDKDKFIEEYKKLCEKYGFVTTEPEILWKKISD